jgi:predicted Zn-dependent protease
LEQDEEASALPLLTKAVQLDAQLLPARASLGKAYLQAGRASEAIPHLKAAVAADADGSVHFQLAKAYERTGQPLLAKRTREQFAAIEKRRAAGKTGKLEAEIAAP